MDVITILGMFAVFAMFVTISTDNIAEVMKAYLDIDKYKLTIASLLTFIGVFGLNIGVLETMGIITNVAQPWIHWYDLTLTGLFLCHGSMGIHKLSDMVIDYFGKKGE